MENQAFKTEGGRMSFMSYNRAIELLTAAKESGDPIAYHEAAVAASSIWLNAAIQNKQYPLPILSVQRIITRRVGFPISGVHVEDACIERGIKVLEGRPQTHEFQSKSRVHGW